MLTEHNIFIKIMLHLYYKNLNYANINPLPASFSCHFLGSNLGDRKFHRTYSAKPKSVVGNNRSHTLCLMAFTKDRESCPFLK